MRAAAFVSSLSLGLGLVACGGAGDSTPADQPDKNVLSWETGAFEVPAGETFECFYTDIVTDRELSVLAASAEQGHGGHHVSVYYVDNKRPIGHASCNGTTEMVDWHFVVGAGGEGNGLGDVATLPEGLAIKVPAGKQLMVQTHYINTSGAAETSYDKLRIQLTDAAGVKAYAADFVIDDEGWSLPPNAAYTSVSTCTLKDDVQIALFLGHMHEHGVHYSLDKIDADDNVLESVYDAEWRPEYASHPPIHRYSMAEPYVLTAGTKLRQTCQWNNTSTDPLVFPTEMCIGFGYYFPGESRIQCETTNEK